MKAGVPWVAMVGDTGGEEVERSQNQRVSKISTIPKRRMGYQDLYGVRNLGVDGGEVQRGRFGFGDGRVGDGILAAHLFARPL